MIVENQEKVKAWMLKVGVQLGSDPSNSEDYFAPYLVVGDSPEEAIKKLIDRRGFENYSVSSIGEADQNIARYAQTRPDGIADVLSRDYWEKAGKS